VNDGVDIRDFELFVRKLSVANVRKDSDIL